ncbi:LysR family transcriptional regulator [Pseudomonadota bacterium]
MDINNLRAFVNVAEHGSFSLAAERLHLTQPAISKRVAVLESELDTRLFDRIGHQVTLTEGGRQLLPRAKDMLNEVTDIKRSLANLTDQVTGTLSMGTSHHIGLHRLPPVLRKFSQYYPDVQLDIQFMGSENACNAVEHGQLELAIATLPTKPSPQLELTAIWNDPLCFVVGKDHPLATTHLPDLKTLSEHQAVLPTIGTYTRDILEQALTPKGITIQTGISTNYLETLKMLVSIGLGWSLLPGTLINDDEFKILQIEELQLTRTLGVIRHQKRTLSNAARAMLEACQKSQSV